MDRGKINYIFGKCDEVGAKINGHCRCIHSATLSASLCGGCGDPTFIRLNSLKRQKVWLITQAATGPLDFYSSCSTGQDRVDKNVFGLSNHLHRRTGPMGSFAQKRTSVDRGPKDWPEWTGRDGSWETAVANSPTVPGMWSLGERCISSQAVPKLNLVHFLRKICIW